MDARDQPHLDGVTHRWVDLPGLRMHVAEAGTGPPVLLLHGWPQHWWEWRHVIGPLARTHHVIAPDLRGAGWSTTLEGPHRMSLQQLVDEGLIVASGDEGRSVYALTDAGRAEVETRADDIARAWDTAPGATDAQQGFGESLQKLFGVLHLYRTTATDTQRAAATEKLDQLRRDLLQILAD